MHPLSLTLTARRRGALIAVAALLVMLGLVVAAVALGLGTARQGAPTADAPTADAPTANPHHSAQAGQHARHVVPGQSNRTSPGTANEVAQLRAAQPVRSAYSGHHRKITGAAARQPGLYARAFMKELLTQDYRTTRDGLLAWVQAESAQTSEPRVIGLVPEKLRGKWAVFSLIQDQTTPPVPSTEQWQHLAARHGHTTVRIQRVIEPVAWSSAVLAGDITDPGITAREVDALVTLHTVRHGEPEAQRFSVALTMNLEGPPTRDRWGFVTAVTYDVVPMGPPR